MALNPNEKGDSHNWNYSKPDQPGYSIRLVGTVKAIQEVQAMNFGPDGKPSTPKFWDNNPAKPVWNIRMVLAGPSGGFRTWTFTPAGKDAREGRKPSVHMDLFRLSGGRNLLDLLEKTISIETDEAPAGFRYGIGSPRPWRVALVTDQGPFQLSEPLDPVYLMPQVLADGAVSGGVMNAPMGSAASQPLPDNMSAMPGGPAPAPAAAPGLDEDIPF